MLSPFLYVAIVLDFINNGKIELVPFGSVETATILIWEMSTDLLLTMHLIYVLAYLLTVTAVEV